MVASTLPQLCSYRVRQDSFGDHNVDEITMLVNFRRDE